MKNKISNNLENFTVKFSFTQEDILDILQLEEKEKEDKEKKIITERIKKSMKGKEMVFENYSNNCL